MPKKISPAQHKLGVLRSHGEGQRVRFEEPVLHGRLRFGKGEVVEFECDEAAAYFDVAFNGTELTTEEPTRYVSAFELDADPDTEAETISADTVVGSGREGVAGGTTVYQALAGEEPTVAPTLQVDDAVGEGS